MLAQVQESFSHKFQMLGGKRRSIETSRNADAQEGRWWVRPDLNQRPRHLQCRALPTKLLTRATVPNALAVSSLPLQTTAIQRAQTTVL